MENNKNDNRKPENPVQHPDPKTTADHTKKNTGQNLNPVPLADTGIGKTPPAIPQNDADTITTPDQHKTDPDTKTKPDTQLQPQFTKNKSNPAADGDGKTAIDHHKKETEQLAPKADPFKRTDYHQPTPDQTFAAANKENMKKHADTFNALPQELPSEAADDVITKPDNTTGA
jgi:hypothetical protein